MGLQGVHCWELFGFSPSSNILPRHPVVEMLMQSAGGGRDEKMIHHIGIEAKREEKKRKEGLSRIIAIADRENETLPSSIYPPSGAF